MEKIEKLELKHLCGYLPHGLKWKFFGAGIYTMCGMTNEKIFVEEGHCLTWNIDFESEQALFPLLLPLSALTEPLEDGTVPIDAIREFNIGYVDFITSERDHWIEMYGRERYIGAIPFLIIEYLYSKHFDIYGLIPAGLAFDKRTVKL